MSEKFEIQVLNEVLTPAMVNEIWTANCEDVLAFTLQDFAVGALLPAMFYMFRRGHRRGQGTFADEFEPRQGETEFTRKSTIKAATVTSVARVLADDHSQFDGFNSDIARSVLSDFLLTHCLENQRHESGRKKRVIRAFPTHYQAAWMDLPSRVGHLRLVPEFLVAVLVDQKDGETIEGGKTLSSFFRVNDDFTQNILLSVFGPGMSTRERQSDLVDEFDERIEMGLDQLATIRVARKCKQPIKLKEARFGRKSGSEGRGSSAIANQHPIAKVAARVFREDTRLFLHAFGTTIPRQSLTQMLEACIGLGLTNIFLSTASSLLDYETHGELSKTDSPWPMLVDCSSGTDLLLRRLSEEVMDDAVRRLHRFPVVLMAIRILDHHARFEIRALPQKRPDSSDRINMLGEVLFDRHEHSHAILKSVRKQCMMLSEQFESNDIGEGYRNVLDDEEAIRNPVLRLAETVCQMMGDKQQISHILACLSSCMMTGNSNGLAMERRVVFQTMRNGKKSGMMKSVVLTDTMLDFLVHRHLRKPGKGGYTKSNPISFSDFVTLLRERYGLLVDQAPRGQTISRELLQRNRRFLERRLRSLGLLMGVNDAESMKRLRPRFNAREQIEE